MPDINKANQSQSIPLSATAYAQLQADIERLSLLRVETMERLKVAREMGDLSENGAYKYAKFELGSLGRQLRDKHAVMKHAIVMQKPINPKTVALGVTVKLQDLESQKLVTYQIVNTHEADVFSGLISSDSPVGQAIMGKRVGDAVHLQTPKGTKKLQILAID